MGSHGMLLGLERQVAHLVWSGLVMGLVLSGLAWWWSALVWRPLLLGLVWFCVVIIVLKGSGVGVVVASRSREGCCPSISL